MGCVSGCEGEGGDEEFVCVDEIRMNTASAEMIGERVGGEKKQCSVGGGGYSSIFVLPWFQL